MLRSATTFNANIGSWNIARATEMSSMFLSATAFNANIGSWNTRRRAATRAVSQVEALPAACAHAVAPGGPVAHCSGAHAQWAGSLASWASASGDSASLTLWASAHCQWH